MKVKVNHKSIALNKQWSNKETARLKKLLDNGRSVCEVASILNRSIFSIKKHLIKINYHKFTRDSYWKKYSDLEIAFLQKFYPIKGKLYCALFLNRTGDSISKKAKHLGLKRLCIHPLINKPGIEIKKGVMRWHQRDIAILRSVYPVKGAKAVAKLVKRTVNAVRKKAYDAGITIRKTITKAQSRLILELRNAGKTFGQIAVRLNMKVDRVYKHFVRNLKHTFFKQLSLFEPA